MSEKILSICMPTYKRREIFVRSYNEIIQQVKESNSEDLVEYVISVNPSQDGTEQFLENQTIETFINININKENIGAEDNISYVLSMATGKYVWLIGDDDILLPGSLLRILNLIKQYSDLAWIYINYGYEDKDKKNLLPMRLVKRIEGYYKDGRAAMLSNFKYLDGSILFTTANVYLREAAVTLGEQGYNEEMSTMLYTIVSSTLGGAYIISEPMINQGQDILWKDREYEYVVKRFNCMLLKLMEVGFTKREVMKLIRERMTNEAVTIWFIIFKELFIAPSAALEHYLWYLKLIPLTTIFMTFTLPIWAIYLLIRHGLRDIKRKKQKKSMV